MCVHLLALLYILFVPLVIDYENFCNRLLVYVISPKEKKDFDEAHVPCLWRKQKIQVAERGEKGEKRGEFRQI